MSKTLVKSSITSIVESALAKSNGVPLHSHSYLTASLAAIIRKESQAFFSQSDINDTYVSGLLHDVAKNTLLNQERLKTNKKLQHRPFRHNEIIWAFLSKHLICPSETSKNIILHNVYWHHGIENRMHNDSDSVIYNTIAKEDIKRLKITVTHLLNNIPGYKCADKPDLDNNPKSPFFFKEYINNYDKFNQLTTYSRMCLISADRIISAFSPELVKAFYKSDGKVNEEYLYNYIRPFLYIEKAKNLSKINYGNARFKIQKNILAVKDKTICYNGPAGFGKTPVGLLWILRNNKKTIWVCPRNFVAESVYHSIIEIFKEFNVRDISVELFLTGRVQQSNSGRFNGFDSDIIITNIDNLVSPTIDNKHADRLFYSVNSNVIFDEYHEYISETQNPLLACFVNLMRTRHRLTNSQTLLLSATPILGLEKYWDVDEVKTKYLPSHKTHFPAAHKKKYLINFVDTIPQVKPDSNSLIFLSSIKNVQEFKINNWDAILYHNEFEDHKKAEKLAELFRLYGKKSSRTSNKTNVISTHALQASADLSFEKLYDSIISPQTTLQKGGRINRWGELKECIWTFFEHNNKSENATKNILYSMKLSKLWIQHLKKYNSKKLTLDNIYNIYNNFHSKYSDEIQSYLKKCLDVSESLLRKIHPVQIDILDENIDIDKKIVNASGNKIRANGNEIFCIFKKQDSDEYSNVFNINPYGGPETYKERFKEKDNITSNQLKAMKQIAKSKDKRFNYSELIEKKQNDNSIIRKAAKLSITPYIRFDKVYNEELGLIDVADSYELLNKIKNNKPIKNSKI